MSRFDFTLTVKIEPSPELLALFERLGPPRFVLREQDGTEHPISTDVVEAIRDRAARCVCGPGLGCLPGEGCDHPDYPFEPAAPVLDDGSVQLPLAVPPELDTTHLDPVTQGALAAVADPDVTRRAVRATRRRPSATVDDLVSLVRAPKPPVLKDGDTVPDGWLPLKDAAQAYGCAYTTIANRCTDGGVRSVKIGGRRYVEPPTR